ncbi:MAG: hypothetical protein AB1347_00825 [Acidobacteriota bacterium]
MNGRRPRVEEFSLSGFQVQSWIAAAWRAVLSRRVVLKSRSGRSLLWIPLFLFAPLVLLEPFWVLLGTVLLLALGGRLSLERSDPAPDGIPPVQAAAPP